MGNCDTGRVNELSRASQLIMDGKGFETVPRAVLFSPLQVFAVFSHKLWDRHNLLQRKL